MFNTKLDAMHYDFMSRVVDDRKQQDSKFDQLGQADRSLVVCNACRKDSVIPRNGGASVAPEAVLLLSARNCRTKISALSTSMRARLKMFTDQSSVNAREMKSSRA